MYGLSRLLAVKGRKHSGNRCPSKPYFNTVIHVKNARVLGPRLALLIMGGSCLLAGLDAALLRMNLPAPISGAALAALHGPLMLVGFLGTVISLERAVAARVAWAHLAPLGHALGSLLLLAGAPTLLGQLLILAGSACLVAIYVGVHRRAASTAADIETLGAISLLLGNLVWIAGMPIETAVPLWLLFPTLTIVGERLELARVAFLDDVVEGVIAGLSTAALLSACLSLVVDWAHIPAGSALLGLGAAMVYHDVARRTIRAQGGIRFAAAAMIAGYAWLMLGGLVWAVADMDGLAGAGYEIVIHCLGMGFSFSMILAHASTIIPAIIHRRLPHHWLMWIPLVFLHLGLAVRVGALLAEQTRLWQLGGVVSLVAILLFLLTAVTRAACSGQIGAKA